MGWRYRKYIQIFPGMKINLSKSGISTTVGKKGASANFGKNGSYLNLGIPGTGFYAREKMSSKKTVKLKRFYSSYEPEKKIGIERIFEISNTWGCVFRWLGMIAIIVVSVNVVKILFGTFDNSYDHRTEFTVWCLISVIFLISIIPDVLYHFYKRKKISLNEISKKIADEKDEIRKKFLQGLLSNYNPDISADDACFHDKLSKRQIESYNRLCKSFNVLCSSDRIWTLYSNSETDQTSSLSNKTLNRREVIFKSQLFNNVRCNINNSVPCLNNGYFNFYIYPKFIVKAKSEIEFEIIDLKEVELKWSIIKYIERDSMSQLPHDSKFVKFTYEHIKKDGTPDTRYNTNRKFPIYQYPKISFEKLSLFIMVSNYEKAKAFVDDFTKHKAELTYNYL